MPYIGNTTSDFSIDTGNITNRAVTATKLSPSSVGSNGQVLSVDGSGNLQWSADANAPEGTAVLSTGESGTTKYLRVDGDGTCSWQVAVDATKTTLTGSTNNTICTVTGANAIQGEADLTFDGNSLNHVVGANTHGIKSTAAGDHYTTLEFNSNRSGAAEILSIIDFKWDGDKVADILCESGSDNTNKDDGHLIFRTSTAQGNIAERLRIKADGKVGIGTTSPDRKLEVQNDGSYAAKFGGASGGSDFAIEIGQTGNSGSPGFNAVAGSMVFQLAGSEKARFNGSTGNFGINNNSPDRKLEVQNDSDYAAKFSGGSGAGHTSIEIGQTALNGSAGFNATGGSMLFDIAGAEKMRIDSSGRLLIGTTTEGDSSADDLTIATTGNTGITLRSGVNHAGGLYFSDATSGADEYKGYVQYDQQNDNLKLGCDSETVVWLHADKKLSVGEDSTGYGQWFFSNRGSSGGDATGGDTGMTIYSDTGATNNTVLSNSDWTLKLANGSYAGTGVSGSQGTVVKILFNGATSNGWNAYGAIGLDVQGTSGGKGDLFFNTGGTTDGNERMRIRSDGRVGLGVNPVYSFQQLKSGAVEWLIGSSDAGSATLMFDGDSNGDGSGSDYSHIRHTTDGNLEYVVRSPATNRHHIFKTNGSNATTTSERFRITEDGITFNGDTGSANALDDYEEGTWTPVCGYESGGGSMSSTGLGHYTKIGHRVFFHMYVSDVDYSSAGTNWPAVTLPFGVANVNNNHSAVTFAYWNCFGSNPFGYCQKGNSHFVIGAIASGNDSTSGNTWVGTNKLFMASGHYVAS